MAVVDGAKALLLSTASNVDSAVSWERGKAYGQFGTDRTVVSVRPNGVVAAMQCKSYVVVDGD